MDLVAWMNAVGYRLVRETNGRLSRHSFTLATLIDLYDRQYSVKRAVAYLIGE